VPIQTELTQQQKLLGILALRSLLERVDKFLWSWERPEDLKDVLFTQAEGLRIELINYRATGIGRLFLRYGGDCCGALATETEPEEGRRMFFDLWERALAACKQQRDEAIRYAFGLENDGPIGFKFTSDDRSPAE
jgi:hypothetical protein